MRPVPAVARGPVLVGHAAVPAAAAQRRDDHGGDGSGGRMAEGHGTVAEDVGGGNSGEFHCIQCSAWVVHEDFVCWNDEARQVLKYKNVS